MKNRWRPFIQQVQQTLSKHLTHTPLPVVNPLWIAARAESRTWQPVMTPEQEASYENEDWVNSTPKEDVQVQVFRKPPQIKDTLYKGPLDNLGLKTSASIPAIKPSSTDAIMSHLCGDTPDQFAAIIGQLIAPTIQDKNIVPRVPTKELHTPQSQITGSLRRATISDPYLPSVRMTPSHEFAIVPRQRATAQLPPRLGDDTADAPEHMTAVDVIVNRAIVTFHQEQTRLPHAITISYIRFLQHWINNPRHRHFFFYHTEYGDVEIPINGACMGEFAVDEVRLD